MFAKPIDWSPLTNPRKDARFPKGRKGYVSLRLFCLKYSARIVTTPETKRSRELATDHRGVGPVDLTYSPTCLAYDDEARLP